jgi:hypothetical protein
VRIRSVAPVLAGLLLISGATAATAFPAWEPPPAIQSAVSSQASAPQDDAPISVGFGARAITPVGEPPAEWAPYVHPHPVTGVWGERWVDTAGDGCHPQPHRNRPPAVHVDDWWNHTGDNRFAGAVTVRGVTIVGDPQSAGKWDGIWGNAGFGSRCALGAHDDIWARAVVIDDGERSVAMVALDVVGLFGIEVERARREVLARYPDMAIDELVVASTHTHQSPDTMGYWGLTLGVDGKYPTYQAFVRSQILDAVREAWEAREPAELRVARTHFDTGIRDSRPPVVIDPWLHAAQFVAAGAGGTYRWSKRDGQGAVRSCATAAPLTVKADVTAHRVGELRMVTGPGEIFSTIANVVKSKTRADSLTGGQVMVFGQTQESLGYIIQSFEVDAAGGVTSGTGAAEYEETFMPDRCFGDHVLDTQLALLARLG